MKTILHWKRGTFSRTSFQRFYLKLIIGALLTMPLTGQTQTPDNEEDSLIIASCQFPISSNMEENLVWILDQMKEAHELGAHLAHFPECALSGYPGVDMLSMEGFQWDVLHQYTDSITSLARELGLWVLLGSIHELSDGIKPMNSLYVIDPSGRIIDRYDKRFCTKGDLDYFSAGNHFVVVDIRGIKCGLLICFDVRFPELYREYKKLGVDLIFQSFYNARQKPGGIHPKIMPVTAQTRAAYELLLHVPDQLIRCQQLALSFYYSRRTDSEKTSTGSARCIDIRDKTFC